MILCSDGDDNLSNHTVPEPSKWLQRLQIRSIKKPSHQHAWIQLSQPTRTIWRHRKYPSHRSDKILANVAEETADALSSATSMSSTSRCKTSAPIMRQSILLAISQQLSVGRPVSPHPHRSSRPPRLQVRARPRIFRQGQQCDRHKSLRLRN